MTNGKGKSGAHHRRSVQKLLETSILCVFVFYLMSRYFLMVDTEEQQQLDGEEENRCAPVSSISSSRNSVVNKEEASLFFFLRVCLLVFLKTDKTRKEEDGKNTQPHNSPTKKMNYLPNHWRRRVALHWPPAVVRLRCSARSAVVYHLTVDETP